MAGKRQKPPGELVYRRGGRAKALVQVAPATVAPTPPEGVGEHAVAVWASFWSSRVSGAIDLLADGEALRHWILCIDEREKLRGPTVRAPLVKGSHEQLMLNPLFRRLRELNREIARAEEQFGMTPLARMRLGVTYLQEQAARLHWRRTRSRGRLMSCDDASVSFANPWPGACLACLRPNNPIPQAARSSPCTVIHSGSPRPAGNGTPPEIMTERLDLNDDTALPIEASTARPPSRQTASSCPNCGTVPPARIHVREHWPILHPDPLGATSAYYFLIYVVFPFMAVFGTLLSVIAPVIFLQYVLSADEHTPDEEVQVALIMAAFFGVFGLIILGLGISALVDYVRCRSQRKSFFNELASEQRWREPSSRCRACGIAHFNVLHDEEQVVFRVGRATSAGTVGELRQLPWWLALPDCPKCAQKNPPKRFRSVPRVAGLRGIAALYGQRFGDDWEKQAGDDQSYLRFFAAVVQRESSDALIKALESIQSVEDIWILRSVSSGVRWIPRRLGSTRADMQRRFAFAQPRGPDITQFSDSLTHDPSTVRIQLGLLQVRQGTRVQLRDARGASWIEAGDVESVDIHDVAQHVMDARLDGTRCTVESGHLFAESDRHYRLCGVQGGSIVGRTGINAGGRTLVVTRDGLCGWIAPQDLA